MVLWLEQLDRQVHANDACVVCEGCGVEWCGVVWSGVGRGRAGLDVVRWVNRSVQNISALLFYLHTQFSQSRPFISDNQVSHCA